MADLVHGRVAGAGVELHYVEAGHGRTVLLLHGFPDFWFGWRHQIQPLAAAGYRVIVPDLRGYNESDRPRGVMAYRQSLVVADVVSLLQRLAPDGADVVGHDWGGVIAWRVAAEQPPLVRSLAILNAPHPDAYVRTLRRAPRQVLRAWYVAANQLPWLPELALRARHFALLTRVLRTDEAGNRMAAEHELDRYREAFERPGALTAAVNYYRAAARELLMRRGRPTGRVSRPVLVVWGERDPALDRRVLDGLERYAADLRIERLPHAGHFVHWQDPGTVNALLLAWLARGGG